MNHELKKSTLIVVPAYNAAQYLPELIGRIRAVITDSNILVVNDGSTDNSLELLEHLNVNIITFGRNKGKGAALKAAFSYARENNYQSVLTIDADLQHAPEEIPKFLSIDNGKRMIIGTRIISGSTMPIERRLVNNLTSLIVSIFSTKRIRDSQSGFRLIPISFIDSIQIESINFDLESELLFKAGIIDQDISEVAIDTIYHDSKSYINPVPDTLRFIRQIWKRIWA